MLSPTEKGPATMTSFSRILRLVAVSAAVLAVTASVAQAKPIEPVGLSSQQSVVGATNGYPGTYRPVVTNVQAPPDRGDLVGTTSQATNLFPVTTPVVVHTTSDSFDWLDAGIGAATAMALMLIGVAAIGLRGRRRMALGT
jgi:hypothetical protein